MISNLQADGTAPRCTLNVEVHPCCYYKCCKRNDDDAILASAFIEWVRHRNGMGCMCGMLTHRNGTQGMRVGDSPEWNAWYAGG